MSNNKKKKAGLLLLAGAALGYVGSLFVSDKAKQKHKAMIEEKVEQLKSILTDDDPAQRIQAIFKKNTAKVRAKYELIKQSLITKLAELKGTLQSIDKQKYEQVLNQVVDGAKKEQELTKTQIKKIKSYLLKDFDKIKKSLK